MIPNIHSSSFNYLKFLLVYFYSYYWHLSSDNPLIDGLIISILDLPLHDTILSDPSNFAFISPGSVNVIFFNYTSAFSNLMAPIPVCSNVSNSLTNLPI
jgi:hypothetical protein